LPLKILGSRVDAVSLQDALDHIQQFLDTRIAHHVITGNTLMCLEAEHDADLRRILEEASLVVPESSGILWASRVMGVPLTGFVPGIDLMLSICRMAAEKGHPAFLLGAAPGVAERAGRALKAQFPGLHLAGTHHGFFRRADDPDIVSLVRRTRPAILFVGMGMPAQEKWIAKNLEALGVPVVMGVGGSFDVLSGKLRRAPHFMRRVGVEWVYRLAQEPWRWKRIAQLPVFTWKVLREKGHGKYDKAKSR
jgi:N-acetylglucosaminyldiphosphoundecaprenol N-acetyl-beta-D-mannosaminyltransferase